MNGILSFDNPVFFFGFIILIPMILLDFSPRYKKIVRSFSKPLQKRLVFSKIFFRISLACVIIALSGPRWGTGPADGEFRRGVDAVIALDVSRSMDINDGYGESGISRLQRGVSIVREAVKAAPEIRYAVAIGKNRGIVAIPLTHDNGVVLDFLEAVSSSSITGRGTNLESLIDAAATAFSASRLSVKTIILVSDGEALSGSLNAAVGRCNREGIIITALAVGSDYGGEVPGYEGFISRRDTAAMKMAAGHSHPGGYIDGNRRDAAETLAAQLRSLAPESEVSVNRTVPKARWLFFTVLALAAFGLSKLCLLKTAARKKDNS